MRPMLFLLLPLLAAVAGCTTTQSADFRNPANGEVATVCGPMTGMTSAVNEAHDGCVDSYKNAGWVRIRG